MSDQKYEIEHVGLVQPEHDCAALIAMLTGYDVGEVWNRLPPRLRRAGGWYGRDFIAMFRQMGFDCSPRFKPFDKDTPYPCLMRFGPSKRLLVRQRQERRLETGDPHAKAQPWWDVMVYYDGVVYNPMLEHPFALEDFSPDYKITSMMQVWISDL